MGALADSADDEVVMTDSVQNEESSAGEEQTQEELNAFVSFLANIIMTIVQKITALFKNVFSAAV